MRFGFGLDGVRVPGAAPGVGVVARDEARDEAAWLGLRLG